MRTAVAFGLSMQCKLCSSAASLLAAPLASAVHSNQHRNVPFSGGLVAMLSGLHFQPTDGSPKGALAAISCGTSSWVSGTSVECLAESATATAEASATVLVAGVAGTLHGFFTFDGASAPSPPSPSRDQRPSPVAHGQRPRTC